MLDSTKLLELTINKIDTDQAHLVLSKLTNLRSLSLNAIKVSLDFKSIFTHLRALRSLIIRFKDNLANKETLN